MKLDWLDKPTIKAQLWAGAEGVYDVDDEAVRGRAQGQRARGHQQGHDVEQERQVAGHCKESGV